LSIPADQDKLGSSPVVRQSKLASNALAGSSDNCQSAFQTKGRQIVD
jgi:hypothetical protein